MHNIRTINGSGRQKISFVKEGIEDIMASGQYHVIDLPNRKNFEGFLTSLKLSSPRDWVNTPATWLSVPIGQTLTLQAISS
jgi:hypothetical protein